MSVHAFKADDSSGENHEALLKIIKNMSFSSGDFTLASGKESQIYFNMKPTMMNPEGAYLCAVQILKLIELKELSPNYVGGLEMGAVPIVSSLSAISYAEDKPIKTFFVRKAAKTHGAKLKIEGLISIQDLKGQTVLVVDDVTTTGGSIVQAIEIAREAGATVTDAVTLVDRSEGAIERLQAENVNLHYLYSAKDFVAE